MAGAGTAANRHQFYQIIFLFPIFMQTKQEHYALLVEQVRSLISGESNRIGILANVAALLSAEMKWWWTGFYLVNGERLELGPFQGPVACFTIKKGRGVCGTAWERGVTIVVPDVEQFPGHIACSAASRSEIVVPLFGADGQVVAVLDVDSEHLSTFDDTDARYLEQVAAIVSAQIGW